MNLIYDRTQSDVDNAIAIRSKYQALGDWSGITEDEIAQLKRGTYSCFDDMNRVDSAVRELGGMLTAAGYPVEYVDPRGLTPSNGGTFSAGAEVSPSFSAGMPVPEPAPPPGEDVWQIGDIVKQSEWVQYIANVQALRDAYYTMTGSPELPEPTAPLTYDGANAIEKLLYDISQLYDAMVTSYRLCGAFRCGNNAQHLPLQRSVI